MINSILVQIASYRDPELIHTVKNLVSTAKNPQNLRICIAWQHDELENIDEIKSIPNLEILDIPYKETKGVGWARNLLQKQYKNEKYILQLDSHHRFVKDWDEKCITMIQDLQAKGSKKPILTTYLPNYNELSGDSDQNYPTKMIYAGFHSLGFLQFGYSQIGNHKQLARPIRSRFFSGHFVFTVGDWDKEVLYDVEWWDIFSEEINMAVRSFTHGYDLFFPHQLIAYHCYSRLGRWIHLYDAKDAKERQEKDALKLRQLLNMDNESLNIDFGIYGIGSERSLIDYEKYAGINFKNRDAEKHTRYHNEPLNFYQ